MLRLGVPSKGRLQEETIAWFAARGIAIARRGGDASTAAPSTGIDGVELVLLSAAEIPAALAGGGLDLGVTGQDLVREEIPRWQERLEELAPLGFGFADLVVAVPAFWIDVAEMADLDAAAAQFRARHGHRLRVATKYRHLVRGVLPAPRRRQLPARRQPGRDRGHGEERRRRGGRRHHHAPARRCATTTCGCSTTG